MKYICSLCDYIYDEKSKTFDSLDEDWQCPQCSAAKFFFETCSCAVLGNEKSTLRKKTKARSRHAIKHVSKTA